MKGNLQGQRKGHMEGNLQGQKKLSMGNPFLQKRPALVTVKFGTIPGSRS